ncbi:MAG: hypothetical protein ACSLE9_15055 [Burkholderiaceae bacterium]
MNKHKKQQLERDTTAKRVFANHAVMNPSVYGPNATRGLPPVDVSRRITRFGKHVAPDEAFDAWTSNDLPRMLAAVSRPTNQVDRHHLLSNIVRALYLRRAETTRRAELFRFAQLHIAELPSLLEGMREHERSRRAKRAADLRLSGKLEAARETESCECGDPFVETFLLACRAYCEVEQYEEADDVWRAAHAMGYAGDEGLAIELEGVQKRRRKNERAAKAAAR